MFQELTIDNTLRISLNRDRERERECVCVYVRER